VNGPRRAATLRIALALALAGAAVAAAAPSGTARDTVAPRRVVSVKDSPGYYPPADPESASVRIGRRLNAPLVRKPFQGGARSLDDLGRAVCRAIHRGDRDSLLALCISDDEFREILWREFPQSRPAVGLEWEDAWRILYARLHAGCMHALRDQGGHWYEFLKFEAGDTTAVYRNFRLHNKLALVVRDDAGQIQRWRWLRSVAEHGGRFKIYSTED